MKAIGKTFLKGLFVVIPITITVYVLYALGAASESMLAPWIRKLIPDPYYIPGIGIAVILAAVLLIGALMNVWILRGFFRLFERLLDHIPLVKTLYGSVKDLMSFFPSGDEKRAEKVVMVRMPGSDMKLLGLLTRDTFADLPKGIGTSDTVAVYLPMSYQIGGFTVMVPRSSIEPIDMSFEDAMRFAVTAGIPGNQSNRS